MVNLQKRLPCLSGAPGRRRQPAAPPLVTISADACGSGLAGPRPLSIQMRRTSDLRDPPTIASPTGVSTCTCPRDQRATALQSRRYGNPV